jgi:hypothetical protein
MKFRNNDGIQGLRKQTHNERELKADSKIHRI